LESAQTYTEVVGFAKGKKGRVVLFLHIVQLRRVTMAPKAIQHTQTWYEQINDAIERAIPYAKVRGSSYRKYSGSGMHDA